MRWRIRTQLLLPVVLLLVGVTGISVTTAASAADQARRQIETRLRNVAQVFSDPEKPLTFPLTPPILQTLHELSGAEYLLVTETGERRSSLEGDPGEMPSDTPVANDWLDLSLGTPVRLKRQTYLCGGIRLRRGPNAGDTLYILYPESLWRDARWQAIRPSLVLGLSVGSAALLIALAQAHRLSTRIRELERRTRLIAAGHFDPMPLPRRDDEIRELARSVNEMGQQLAQFQKTVQQTERLRLLGQVSGGLAHQLRNGLTGARLAVQQFLREVLPGTDTLALEVALRQLTLMETHVKRFLDLGHNGPARREPCDLAGLVGEAVELLRPQCRHADIVLAWTAPERVHEVSGDAGQLGQLIVNLLGNAIEAAGPGGKVEVLLFVEAGRFVLEVKDNGPGPPATVAERLFEPFVTGKPEGVGLGLAVARQVVEGHGGRIGWRREDGWTCFRVELPGRS